MLSPFEVLGVSPDATDAEVKAAWREIVKRHHPDVGGDPRAFALFKRAYEAIDTAEKRARCRASAPASSGGYDPVESIRAAQNVVTDKLGELAETAESVARTAELLSKLFRF